jgi:hypothetical protein
MQAGKASPKSAGLNSSAQAKQAKGGDDDEPAKGDGGGSKGAAPNWLNDSGEAA